MEEEKGYYVLPQPEEVSVREREDAMGAYLMMFAALAVGLPLPVINLAASIIYYYINRNVSRFVHFHSLQSLYSQIPTSLLNAALVFWTVRIILYEEFHITDVYKGFVAMVIIANILYVIFSIVAAAKARKGRFYYLIFFGKLAYQQVFFIKKERPSENKAVNLPPSL